MQNNRLTNNFVSVVLMGRPSRQSSHSASHNQGCKSKCATRVGITVNELLRSPDQHITKFLFQQSSYQTSHLAHKSRDRAVISHNGHKHDAKCEKHIKDAFHEDNISSTIRVRCLRLREMRRHDARDMLRGGDYICGVGNCGVSCSKLCLIAS